jgi:hypothetical protein
MQSTSLPSTIIAVTGFTGRVARAAASPRTFAIAATFALLISPATVAQKSPDLAPYLMPDRAAEIALARTAAPARISDSASVLVLGRSGFVEAAHGSNGFTCLVARSFNGGFSDPTFWSPLVRAPHCLNPAASRTVLPELVKRAEWIMAGIAPTEIATRTQQAYASHALPSPDPGAMAYMLSHEQVLGDKNPHWMPHLMFYFDKSVSASAWGAGAFSAPIINASAGDPSAPILTLFIPVRQWSDGTPALGH